MMLRIRISLCDILSACTSRSGYSYVWIKPLSKQCASILTIDLQCPINSFCTACISFRLHLYLFFIPHCLLSQGTMCKAWPRVNSVALLSPLSSLLCLSLSVLRSYFTLCIASIALQTHVQTSLQRWSLNPHLTSKYLGIVRWSNARVHYQWGEGSFHIHSVNFREQSDSRMHEHYNSLVLTQACPNNMVFFIVYKQT